MKEILTLARIQKDLLAVCPKSQKYRQLIQNCEFVIAEDYCAEPVRSNAVQFLQHYAVFTDKSLRIPSLPYMKPVRDYLNDHVYKNHKFYLVCQKDRRVLLIYDAALCTVASNLMVERSPKPPFLVQKGLITKQLLNEIDEKRPKPTILERLFGSSDHWWKSQKLFARLMLYLGEDSAPDSYDSDFIFRNSEGTLVISGSRKVACVQPDGTAIWRDLSLHRLYQNQVYYIFMRLDRPEYIFSADHWNLSPELNSLSLPCKKPDERKSYLEVMEPFFHSNLAHELYGNDTVSVVNYANFCYGISDYRKADGIFVFAQVPCDIVHLLFNHPDALHFIMSHPSHPNIQVTDQLQEQLSTLCEYTQKNGPNKIIDLEMDQEIMTNHQHDIFQ